MTRKVKERNQKEGKVRSCSSGIETEKGAKRSMRQTHKGQMKKKLCFQDE